MHSMSKKDMFKLFKEMGFEKDAVPGLKEYVDYLYENFEDTLYYDDIVCISYAISALNGTPPESKTWVAPVCRYLSEGNEVPSWLTLVVHWHEYVGKFRQIITKYNQHPEYAYKDYPQSLNRWKSPEAMRDEIFKSKHPFADMVALANQLPAVRVRELSSDTLEVLCVIAIEAYKVIHRVDDDEFSTFEVLQMLRKNDESFAYKILKKAGVPITSASDLKAKLDKDTADAVLAALYVYRKGLI